MDTHNVSGSQSSSGKQPDYSHDVFQFNKVCGETPTGRPKATMMLSFYNYYSDDTRAEIGEPIILTKPIVHVFSRFGLINIYLDFKSGRDNDLRYVWQKLQDYFHPSNSVSYLPEELESGFYETEKGRQRVFFPTMDLILSPVGKENEIVILAHNPVIYNILPNEQGENCVIQLAFTLDTVATSGVNIDYDEIYSEILEEQAAEERYHKQIH